MWSDWCCHDGAERPETVASSNWKRARAESSVSRGPLTRAGGESGGRAGKEEAMKTVQNKAALHKNFPNLVRYSNLYIPEAGET